MGYHFRAFIWALLHQFGRRDGTGHRMWFSDCWWLSGELIREE